VSGQILGIVGYGSIGRAIAAPARGLEMKVLALRRRVPRQCHEDLLIDHVYGAEDRLDMLSRCDYVVVALPLTEQTRGLIADCEFAVMMKQVVVMNVGCGLSSDVL